MNTDNTIPNEIVRAQYIMSPNPNNLSPYVNWFSNMVSKLLLTRGSEFKSSLCYLSV